MSVTPRLLEVTDSLRESGLRFLIMGGHAVRYFGVDRNTLDFDFHVRPEDAAEWGDHLQRAGFFGRAPLVEGPTWRANDFRRYQIGVLPNGKEEWLEFWFRGHLLAPFAELYQRREEAKVEGRTLDFLSLADLIRSKETERDDDWADVRLLEEIQDNRNLATARDDAGNISALSQLRSRRGFERAEAADLFGNASLLEIAFSNTIHPITLAYLLPFVRTEQVVARNLTLESAVVTALRHVQAGSSRHLAIVEAVRLAYQRSAKAADHADKQKAIRPS